MLLDFVTAIGMIAIIIIFLIVIAILALSMIDDPMMGGWAYDALQDYLKKRERKREEKKMKADDIFKKMGYEKVEDSKHDAQYCYIDDNTSTKTYIHMARNLSDERWAVRKCYTNTSSDEWRPSWIGPKEMEAIGLKMKEKGWIK